MGDKSSKGIMISSLSSFFGDFTLFCVLCYLLSKTKPITYFFFFHLDILHCRWGCLRRVFLLFLRLVFGHNCDWLEVREFDKSYTICADEAHARDRL